MIKRQPIYALMVCAALLPAALMPALALAAESPAAEGAEPATEPDTPTVAPDPAPADAPSSAPTPPAPPAAPTAQTVPVPLEDAPQAPKPPPPGFTPTGTRPEPTVDAFKEAVRAAEAEIQPTLPLDELRVFAEVFGRIKSDYVESVDDRDLLSSAIRGMLAGLDPHSAYLDPDDYEDLQVGTSGEFGGLGIEVGMEDGFVNVIAPIDDTPAERAGIQAGDLIVRIDDKPVKGMSLGDAVELMRGEPGSTIELTLMRDGVSKPIQVTIERAIIKVASVKQRLLEPGFGYLRIANFQARTTDDLLQAVQKLKEESEGPLKGVVLDLRNNPGGVLNTAVGVSDAFLDEGLIVYTEGRMNDAKLEFRAGPDDVLAGAPMVVLVNGGSASASEIVAGALQDQRRALIMGNDTFGKGSVQTIIPVDDRTALKLTTARYYTPNGRSIQAHGIEPDIRLERGKLTLESEPEVSPLKEANLMRHLEDAGEADLEPSAPAETADQDEEKPLAAEDYQLSEALNVLKGLAILGQAPETPDAETQRSESQPESASATAP